MSEERRMILKMLEEGKINAAEAVTLLNAVSDGASSNAHGFAKEVAEEASEASDEIRRTLKEAKEASKEALQNVKSSVHEALEESRKVIRETLRSKKVVSNIDRVREVDPDLAQEWEEAEEEFSQAKEMLSEVRELEEQIEEALEELAELKEELKEEDVSIGEFQEKETELKQKIKDMTIEKEKLSVTAKHNSQLAQERILKVRRKCKELEIDFENNATIEDDFSEQFQQVGEVIQKATSQIGPMISEFLEGLNLGNFEGHEVVEDIVWKPEKESENVVLNVNLQNGSVRVFGDEARTDILFRIRKKIRASRSEVERLAKDLVDIKCAGNIASVEVIRKFNNRNSVSAELYLPMNYLYDCNFRSTNGRISIDNVKGEAWLLSTTNGRVEVKDCVANHIQAGSTNGSIRFNADVKKAEISASNGSIRYYPPKNANGNISIISKNGSIRICPDKPFQASLIAETKVGKVKVDGDWNIQSSYKKTVGHSIKAYTVGLIEDEPHVDIVAKTINGSIKVVEE